MKIKGTWFEIIDLKFVVHSNYMACRKRGGLWLELVHRRRSGAHRLFRKREKIERVRETRRQIYVKETEQHISARCQWILVLTTAPKTCSISASI